jgi:hypothetical protein
MDPWLEHPELFPTVHDGMCFLIMEAMQSRLPNGYFASLGSRIWFEDVTTRHPVPDVSVWSPSRDDEAGGGVALAAATETAVVVTVPPDETKETFVEVFTNRDGSDRLVTVIEVLSFSNKTPGDHGRDLYLRKQQELIAGKTNLVEIDLLRAGRHTTAVPRAAALAKAGSFDYHVCVHRFFRPWDYVVYPVPLARRLPTVAVPLLPGDGDVPLDLQVAFARAYDSGPARRKVKYDAPPVPPLSPEQAEWAKGVVAQRGTETDGKK